MYRSATAAMVRNHRDSDWEDAIAIMKNPGVSDVQIFVLCETGEVCTTVWDYYLTNSYGCFTIPKDEPREEYIHAADALSMS